MSRDAPGTKGSPNNSAGPNAGRQRGRAEGRGKRVPVVPFRALRLLHFHAADIVACRFSLAWGRGDTVMSR